MTQAESKAIAQEVIECGFYVEVRVGNRYGVLDVLTGEIKWE